MTGKPHHSTGYSDPDPHHETADKINTLIESTPDCRGLAIMIPRHYIEVKNMSKFLSSTCRFAVYNTPVDPTPSFLRLRLLRSTMESIHLVELKQRPIVVVASGYVHHHYMYTDHGNINIKDDIVEPLFSPDTSHLADIPKIFLFIVRYGFSYSSIQEMFPSSGGNYIVGFFSWYPDVDTVISRILHALESPQESVQEIFKSLEIILKINYPHRLINREIDHPSVPMIVIDHLNEPVYLHPDASHGTHSRPGKPHPPHNTSHTLPPYRTHQEAVE